MTRSAMTHTPDIWTIYLKTHAGERRSFFLVGRVSRRLAREVAAGVGRLPEVRCAWPESSDEAPLLPGEIRLSSTPPHPHTTPNQETCHGNRKAA